MSASSAALNHLSRPAQTLDESAQLQRLEQKELGADSPFYADLGAARGTDELAELTIFLRRMASVPNAYAKAAFVGNRGAGKSTYLLHLERKLQDAGIFTPLHFYLDKTLEADCDYSDLLLWIVMQIARQFLANGTPIPETELESVTDWFAEKSAVETTEIKKEISVATEAEAKAGYGLPGIASLKILARLRSMILGSEKSRREIRSRLQNYASELLDRVNLFLDQARATLKANGKPDRLLIVVDNLDRLSREVATPLFQRGGDILTGVRSDIIYTAPLALNLAPYSISSLFGHVCTMPNVKVLLKDGSPHPAGVEGLRDLVKLRLSIEKLFEDDSVVTFLIEKSGGSVRDLIRLLDAAQLKAQVGGREKVNQADAEGAVRKLSMEFSRFLLPGNVYYPILAEIHETHADPSTSEGQATVKSVEDARVFFAQLIGNGSVLEYNGNDSWYDAHPCLCELTQFKDALQTRQAAQEKARSVTAG